MGSTIGEAPLWLRILRVPGWRWAPGVPAVHINWRTVEVREVDEAKGVATCLCDSYAGVMGGPVEIVLSVGHLRPDPFAPAMAGHLLTLARQAYNDATITTQHYPTLGVPERKRWRVWREGCPIAYGETEVEALVAAIEAAPSTSA